MSKEIAASSALIPASSDLRIYTQGHILRRGWRVSRLGIDRKGEREEKGGQILGFVIDGADLLSPIPLDALGWGVEIVSHTREGLRARKEVQEEKEENEKVHHHSNHFHHEHADVWRKRGELALLTSIAHNIPLLQKLFPDPNMQNHISMYIGMIEHHVEEGKGIDTHLVGQLFDKPLDFATHQPLPGYKDKSIEQQLRQQLKQPEFAQQEKFVLENAAALANHDYRQLYAHLSEREKVDKWARNFDRLKIIPKFLTRVAMPIASVTFLRAQVIDLLDEYIPKIGEFLNHPKTIAAVFIAAGINLVVTFISGIIHAKKRNASIAAIDDERKTLAGSVRKAFEQHVLAAYPDRDSEHSRLMHELTNLHPSRRRR